MKQARYFLFLLLLLFLLHLFQSHCLKTHIEILAQQKHQKTFNHIHYIDYTQSQKTNVHDNNNNYMIIQKDSSAEISNIDESVSVIENNVGNEASTDQTYDILIVTTIDGSVHAINASDGTIIQKLEFDTKQQRLAKNSSDYDGNKEKASNNGFLPIFEYGSNENFSQFSNINFEENFSKKQCQLIPTLDQSLLATTNCDIKEIEDTFINNYEAQMQENSSFKSQKHIFKLLSDTSNFNDHSSFSFSSSLHLKKLIDNSPFSHDGLNFIGSKSTDMFEIDILTGTIFSPGKENQKVPIKKNSSSNQSDNPNFQNQKIFFQKNVCSAFNLNSKNTSLLQQNLNPKLNFARTKLSLHAFHYSNQQELLKISFSQIHFLSGAYSSKNSKKTKQNFSYFLTSSIDRKLSLQAKDTLTKDQNETQTADFAFPLFSIHGIKYEKELNSKFNIFASRLNFFVTLNKPVLNDESKSRIFFEKDYVIMNMSTEFQYAIPLKQCRFVEEKSNGKNEFQMFKPSLLNNKRLAIDYMSNEVSYKNDNLRSDFKHFYNENAQQKKEEFEKGESYVQYSKILLINKVIWIFIVVVFVLLVFFCIHILKRRSQNILKCEEFEYKKSSKILGHGCNGTLVYESEFLGRRVAIKRLLKHYMADALKEIKFLIDLDRHPNIVRYYAIKHDDNFVYVVLELCKTSLFDEFFQNNFKTSTSKIDKQTLIYEICSAISHLHNLDIVHRDIKPHNILLSYDDKARISDMGLSKKFHLSSSHNTSYSHTSKTIAGSQGQQAPELILSAQQTQAVEFESSNTNKQTNLMDKSKAGDIFSLGCLIYWILTDGWHPFGSLVHLRNMNIINDNYSLKRFEKGQCCYCREEQLHQELDSTQKFQFNFSTVYRIQSHCTCDDISRNKFSEQTDLVRRMIENKQSERLSINDVLGHVWFWDDDRRLQFLCDVSDRIEKLEPSSPLLIYLERRSHLVFGGNNNSQDQRLDLLLLSDLVKYRKYSYTSLSDLLRIIRNKRNHFDELPIQLRQKLGTLPSGYLNYFSSRFPRLLLTVFETMLVLCSNEHRFRKYFDKFSLNYIRQMRLEIGFDNDEVEQ